jgi:hypothetical protein
LDLRRRVVNQLTRFGQQYSLFRLHHFAPLAS